MLEDHLDGLSFRALGDKYGVSKTTAWEVCHKRLKGLPDNNKFSHKYCRRYSGVLMPDGKYFSVKGYKYGACLLWGVDYFKHDFPVMLVAPSENFQSWGKFFFLWKLLGHHFDVVVCDDNKSLKDAARRHFPKVHIQTCYIHLKEGIRRDLNIRSREDFRGFFAQIQEALDTTKRVNPEYRRKLLFEVFSNMSSDISIEQMEVLNKLQAMEDEMFNYTKIPKTPMTTNLIEGFNSHLETRLASIKSFNSIEHAQLWMNGYVLKRRFTKFKECSGRFRFLNGQRPIDQTKNPDLDIPILF